MKYLAITITLLLSTATKAFPVPITYTFSGLISAFSFNSGVEIKDVPASFIISADTSTLAPGPSPDIVNETPFLGYTFLIDGQSIAEGTPGFYGALYASDGGVHLFTTNEPEIIISFSSPGLSTYDLTTPIGPLSGAAVINPNGFTSGQIIGGPDGGGLALEKFTDVTFTATIAPEPSSAIYCLLSAYLFAGVAFRGVFSKLRSQR